MFIKALDYSGHITVPVTKYLLEVSLLLNSVQSALISGTNVPKNVQRAVIHTTAYTNWTGRIISEVRFRQTHSLANDQSAYQIRSKVKSKSKQCIAVSISLVITATENSHAIRDHTMLPASRQWWESHLYPKPKQKLDLATLNGCRAELTYAMWKRSGRELNPRPVNRTSNALPLSHHAT